MNEDGLQQWKPVLKASFPVSGKDVAAAFEALGVAAPALERSAYSRDQLVAELIAPSPALRAVEVHKRRDALHLRRCMTELTDQHGAGRTRRTLADRVRTRPRARSRRDLGLRRRGQREPARAASAVLVGFGTALRGRRRRDELGEVPRRRARRGRHVAGRSPTVPRSPGSARGSTRRVASAPSRSRARRRRSRRWWRRRGGDGVEAIAARRHRVAAHRREQRGPRRRGPRTDAAWRSRSSRATRRPGSPTRA